MTQVVMQEESVETHKRQYCTFWISGRHFGVDIQDVKEISPEVDFTPIFHAPQEVRGYINIRGHIYLILDLRLILGFETQKVEKVSRVVLFKSEVGEPFGVLVDSIGDILAVDEGQIENRRRNDHGPPKEGGERRGRDIADGVCKLPDGLLVIVKSKSLLSTVTSLNDVSTNEP